MKRVLDWVIEVMKFVNDVSKTTVSISVTKQLVDAAGSTGANLVEARAARSHKEFISSTGIAAKECKESLFWLVVLDRLALGGVENNKQFQKEGNEIASILTSICKNAKLSTIKE